MRGWDFTTRVNSYIGTTNVDMVNMLPPANMHSGDVVARHNHLRDIYAALCRRAHTPVGEGYGLGPDHVNSRPADVLVQGWDRGKPAAFYVTVTSVLSSATINEASAAVGAAAEVS